MSSRVSVVVLSHRPQFLAGAVASALAQTVPVNVLVQHDRDGWAGKLNEIVAASRREWIVPLCDDDLLAPRYVERCLRFADDGDMIFTDRRMWWQSFEWRNWRSWVQRTPSLGYMHRMFGAEVADRIVRENGEAVRVEIAPSSFLFGSPLPMTCMIRRSLWESLGGYDDIAHADTEFWYRAIKAGARVVYVPEPLFRYRFHGGQHSQLNATNGAAAVAFHTKHFLDFGVAFTPSPLNPDLVDAEIIPAERRVEWLRRHGMKVAS